MRKEKKTAIKKSEESRMRHTEARMIKTGHIKRGRQEERGE